jgi:hypothetical protein
VLEVESAEAGFDECREDVAVAPELLDLETGGSAHALAEPLAEPQQLPDLGTARAADDVRPGLREPAFREVGKALVERLSDRQVEDAVAEELEPLVGQRPVLDEGRVRQDTFAERRRQLLDQLQEPGYGVGTSCVLR